MAIAHVSTGSRSAGSAAAPAPAYPASPAANYLALAHIPLKPNTAQTNGETGWGLIGTATGGSGAIGADTGPTRITVYGRIATGSESGSVTFDNLASPSSSFGVIQYYSKASGKRWRFYTYTSSDASSGTGRSHTFSNVELQAGDVLVYCGASDTDSATAFTTPSSSQSGITFGGATIRLNAGGVITGNDSGNWIADDSVSSGSGTNTLTFTLAAGPTNTGPCLLIVLREVDPYAAPTLNAYTEPTTWNSTTTPRDTASAVSWADGDLIVAIGLSADNLATMGTPTATGLTFVEANLMDFNVGFNGSACWGRVWYARASGSGSDQITFTRTAGTQEFGGGVWHFTDSEGIGFVTVEDNTTETTSFPISNDNSHLLWVSGDWSAGAADGTWSPSIGTGDTVREASAFTNFSVFAADWDDQDTGLVTVGYDHTTTGRHSKFAVEVLGAVAASTDKRPWPMRVVRQAANRASTY